MKFRHLAHLAASVAMALALAAMVIQPTQASPDPPSAKPRSHVCSVKPFPRGRAWKMEYSFGGGLPVPGRGSVHLLLHSDGKAVLTISVYNNPPRTRVVTLPPKAMARISGILRKSPPACMHTTGRKGYTVVDMGAYMLRFTSAGKSITARVDECHYVNRGGKVFEAIVDGIQDLKPYLGEEITWNTMAATSMKSDACEPQANRK